MADTTYFTSGYNQEDVARELTSFADQGFMRFARTTGVDHRSLGLPLSRYPKLTGFTEANTAYIEVPSTSGSGPSCRRRSTRRPPHHDEVDIIVAVSSTGVTVPTIDAPLAPAVGLRPDVSVSRCSASGI